VTMTSQEKDNLFYEDSDPDKYATSVYSAPHWMISRENPNKRRKLQAFNAPQELMKPFEMTAVPLPESRDLSSGNRSLCRPEPEISDFSYVASARLSWSWLCRSVGLRDENIASSIRAQAYKLPQMDIERQINRMVNANLERKIKRKVDTNFERMKRKLIKSRKKNSKLEVVSNKAASKSLDQEIKMRLAEEEKCRVKYEDQIVSLFCNHCKLTFKAKPTYRKRFNHTLINHTCSGTKRKQYVLGVKRRKCTFSCNSYKGCIYRL